MIQVTTVAQAIEAAGRGADVIIAQGGEAGGYGGIVSTMALVPQVVDVVSPIPVVAAGGIFDGRGIAAAFMLGAVGVNMGTRFLASKEAPIEDAWKAAIAAAQSEDAVKVEVLNEIQPLPGTGGYGTVLRSLRTPFMDEWGSRRAGSAGAFGQKSRPESGPAGATKCCSQRVRLPGVSRKFCPSPRSSAS
jgi:nitronate monooxygenase/enoyl-[acyl-carrier protein] reductase II